MNKWLFKRSPSYEYIEGATSDEDTESIIEENPILKAHSGSTYSPYSSNARYVPVVDSSNAKSKEHWCLQPAPCCVTVLSCFADKEKLQKSKALVRWKVATGISLALLLFLAAVLCIFFFVAAPKIVQVIVDDSELSFDSLLLTDPFYSNTTQSFRMLAKGLFSFDLMRYGANLLTPLAQLSTSFPLFTFEGEMGRATFRLFYRGHLLGHFILPKTKITVGDTSAINIDTVVTIDDLNTFDEFGRDAINNDIVIVRMSGSCDLTALSQTFEDVSLDKVVSIAAAGGLKDVEIVSFDLGQSNKTNINVAMVAKIYNPSLLTIAPLGRLEFIVMYENYSMASMISDNVTLVKGNNYVSMFGALQPSHLETSDKMIARYFAGKNNTVIAGAKQGSESSIELWARILKGFALTAELEGNATNLISQLGINALIIDPIDNVVTKLTQDISITVSKPLGESPIDLKQVLLKADLLYPIPPKEAKEIARRLGLPHLSRAPPPQYLILGHLLMKEPLNITDGGQPVVNIDYTVDLELFEEGKNFAIFIELFVKSDTVNITLNGTMDANVSTVIGLNKLKGLLLNTTATLKGLNNLPNITIISFDLPRNSPLGGVEILLNSSLFNPTVATTFLGNTSFQVTYEGYPMGVAGATNLKLFPGTVEAIMKGNILPPADALEAAGMLFSDYVKGVDAVVGVKGYSIETNIEWLKEMVQTVNTTTILPGWTQRPIKGVELISLGMNFETGGLPRVNSSLVVNFVLPFDFPLEIYEFAASLVLLYEGSAYAKIDVPMLPASSNQSSSQLFVSFSDLEIVVFNNSVFSEFINDLLLHPSATLSIAGDSDATANTAMGNITLRGISFLESVSVIGIDGFTNPPVEVVESDVVGGYPEYLQLLLTLKIINPSPASLNVGPLSVTLMVNNTFVGNGTISDLSLSEGVNHLTASGYFVQTDYNYDATYEFLSNFAQGKEMNITIKGIPSSVKYDVLRQAVGNLVSPAVIPYANRSLITYAKLEFNLLAFLAGWLPVKLTIFNPYNVRLNLDSAHVAIYNQGVKVGLNIIVEAKGAVVTQTLHVVIEGFTLNELWALFTVIRLDVNGTLYVIIGNGFESGLFYAQDKVPGSFRSALTEEGGGEEGNNNNNNNTLEQQIEYYSLHYNLPSLSPNTTPHSIPLPSSPPDSSPSGP